MKKNSINIIALMYIATFLTLMSCQREGAKTLFRAMIDSPDKTFITYDSDSRAVVCWESGDAIALYVDEDNTPFTLTTHGMGTTAYFECGGKIGDGHYRAIYPAAIATSNNTIWLSGHQIYSRSRLNAPMCASSDSKELAFHHLCGGLKINLTTLKKVSSIEVTADKPLTGDFRIDYGDATHPRPTMSHTANGSNTTTLGCPEDGVDCARGEIFYINMPAETYDSMTIVIHATDGSSFTVTVDSTLSIGQGGYHAMFFYGPDFLEQLPEGSLPGRFTINAFGRQVRFSKGNLLYIDDASTPYWAFADSQWRYMTYQDNDIPMRKTLFGWGTGNNPTLTTTDSHDSGYSVFVDWGENAICNGGNEPNLWRTLTIGDWDYILNVRQTVNNIGIPNLRYAQAVVYGQPGLLIFPDEYFHPYNVAIPKGVNGDSDASYGANRYGTGNGDDWGNWALLEKAGVVFLPRAYRRSGNDLIDYDMCGYYWSSSDYSYDLRDAYCLQFSSSIVRTDTHVRRSNGLAVRLVQDIE